MNKIIIAILMIFFPLIGTSELIKTDSGRQAEKETVSREAMSKIYEEVKNPYKYGVVMKSDNGADYLCPNVFMHGDKWLMVYVSFNGVGYQTHFAESDNLLKWRPKGNILTIPGKG